MSARSTTHCTLLGGDMQMQMLLPQLELEVSQDHEQALACDVNRSIPRLRSPLLRDMPPLSRAQPEATQMHKVGAAAWAVPLPR